MSTSTFDTLIGFPLLFSPYVSSFKFGQNILCHTDNSVTYSIYILFLYCLLNLAVPLHQMKNIKDIILNTFTQNSAWYFGNSTII